MSLPRYPEYKASGVEWLGDVPGHWEVIRLKNVLHQRITDGPHTTPKFIDDGVPFLSVDGIQDGELKFEGCRYISESDHEEYRTKALPRKDDLLMGKAASTGKIARVKVDFEFSIWSPLALIRLDTKVSNPAFYEQSLKSPIVQAQIDNLCTANTQKNISMDDIPRLILTRPPLAEQNQIAAFLDLETGKIDGLIAEQRRLVELLAEKRQAVISHAVTRGLNPNAPMKNSGIEWLGDVPEHWDVKRLKFLCDVQTGDKDTVNAIDDGEYPFFVRSQTIERINSFTFDCEAVLTAGDGVGVGKVYHYVNGKFDFHQRVYMMNNFRFVAGKFFFQYLAATFHKVALGGGAKSTVDSLRMPLFMNFEITVPSIDEQSEIIEFLAIETAKFDTLTAEANRAIELLQERRSALISAAVTGKVDVRKFV